MWQISIILTLFFISGSFALLTLYPRVSKKSGNFSLIYFKDAINVKTGDITKYFVDKNSEEMIIKDYINNIKIVSGIVDKKFNKLRLSYIFFALAIFSKIFFEIQNGWFTL